MSEKLKIVLEMMTNVRQKEKEPGMACAWSGVLANAASTLPRMGPSTMPMPVSVVSIVTVCARSWAGTREPTQICGECERRVMSGTSATALA